MSCKEDCAQRYFTSYYRLLVLWVKELRRADFADGRRWENEDLDLYSSMRNPSQSFGGPRGGKHSISFGDLGEANSRLLMIGLMVL